jgi:hypothetical protein
LFVAAVLGALLARLGLNPVKATHGCRHVGKPCTKSGQCCPGARCKNGSCQCTSTHYKCGSLCCLDGALCLPLNNSVKICHFGDKQPGDNCDPAKPGQCESGVCVCVSSECYCREADCRAPQQMCDSALACCRGSCFDAADACGGGKRCCRVAEESCKDDCDCCFFPDHACREGQCCKKAGASCLSGVECCGELVCESAQCTQLV